MIQNITFGVDFRIFGFSGETGFDVETTNDPLVVILKIIE
jgi:hypothetical protein